MPKIPGAQLTEVLQEAGEEALRQQTDLLNRLVAGGDVAPDTGASFGDHLTDFGSEIGAFKARVQTGGRVSIPDAERDALGIGEEDLVQVFVVPVDKNGTGSNED
jgi:hypothetical protein